MTTYTTDELRREARRLARRLHRPDGIHAIDDLEQEIVVTVLETRQDARNRQDGFGFTRANWRLRDIYRRERPARGIDDEPAIEAKAHDHDLRLDVNNLLRRAKLTAQQSKVIALRFYAGKTLIQTGEILGLTEGAVKSLEYRAIEKLRVTAIGDLT